MTRFWLLLAAVLFALPAHAGSLTWTVTTSGGAEQFVADIEDADIARVIAAHRSILRVAPETTDTEVQRLIIRGALETMIQNTVNTEKAQAAEAAKAAVAPIVATPQE